MSTMSIVCSHADYEQRHLDERDYAADLENTRRALWLRTHDNLDGYKPLREFPCTGMLRIVNDNGSFQIIECDVCRFETTSRVERVA